jgi:hypothetical protein
MSTIVVMPGGFHPFHAGHKALHESAMAAFPGASMYIAATNDTKTRPFPFAVKEKLAKVSGIPSGQFVQVKSPFQPREITSQFDPNNDVLIFVRSEKDKNESPTPGGTKKDGSPNYFQPYTKGQLQPFGKQAYMAYLPTVEFGPGLTSATEIRDAWPTLDNRRKTALVMSLYPAAQKNKRLADVVVRLLDSALGGAEPMNESQSILQVPNNIANTVAELLNHKKPDLFTRYGPEYVMNIIQDVCADAPTKSITELAVETLERLKIKSKKKAKSLGESMVIGCCPNESQGLPMPGTYEQEYDMYKTHGGPKRITALTTEDSDSSDREVQAMLRFAQQHYPEASKQEAFMKFVLHALKHSEQDDNRQDAELQNLDHEVDNIEHEVNDIESKVGNVTESADYLEEK